MVLGTTTKILIIVFALLLIALVILRLKRRGKNTSKLKLDPVGLWKYHQDTQFDKKVAYGNTLETDGDGKKDKSEKAKSEKDRKPVVVLELSLIHI